jgi:hypothetical protein
MNFAYPRISSLSRKKRRPTGRNQGQQSPPGARKLSRGKARPGGR